MNSLSGHDAEELVAEYLVREGYKILARNWRTPACELDIVASKSRRVYVIEVKYRLSSRQGGGLEYINKAKIKKLKLGVKLWQLQNGWRGEVGLLAASLEGRPPFVELVEVLV